jgi:hypothetical protein
MWGYPVFRVPTEASGPISGEAVNPQVGANFLAHRSVIFIFLLGSRRRPPGSAHHQHKNIDDGPPGGVGAEGPRASTTNV